MKEEGYRRCKINGVGYYVHRIIAVAFIAKPEHLKDVHYEELEVNHKDGNKSNNRIDNLEWCTPSENAQHVYDELGHKNIHTIVQYDLQGNLIREYRSAREAGRAVGAAGNSNIIQCCKGRLITSFDSVWRYKGEPFSSYFINRSVD